MKIKRKNLFINSAIYAELMNGERLTVIDGGARGELFAPFNRVNPDRLKVIRFEPDDEAEIKVGESEVSYNKGIWKGDETVQLNVAKYPTCSSVYPPNQEFLERFDNRVGFPPRKTTRKIDINCTSIDQVSKELNIPIDFIKLDVHSSEYNALLGAENNLTNSTLGVLVETWASEVHKGQHLNGDIERLLNNFDFYLFEITKLYSWALNNHLSESSKKRAINLEGLYYNEKLRTRESVDMKQFLKLVALYDLFGFKDHSYEVLETGLERGLFSENQFRLIENQLLKDKKPLFIKLVEKGMNKVSDMLEKYYL